MQTRQQSRPEAAVHQELILHKGALRTLLLQRTQYRSGLKRYANRLHLGGTYSRLVEPWIESLRRGAIRTAYERELAHDLDDITSQLDAAPHRVLDIGAGLGGIDVLLNRRFRGSSPEFWLLDRFRIDAAISYGFAAEASAYCDQEETRRFLCHNGIDERRLHLVDADADEWPATRFDLVVSLISWGFHYPVETYAGKVAASLAKGGVVILDVRRESGGMEELQRWFPRIDVIAEASKHVRVAARAADRA